MNCRGEHCSPGTYIVRICIGFRQNRNILLHGRAMLAPTKRKEKRWAFILTYYLPLIMTGL